MRALGVRHTCRKARCYKPYLKQEYQVCSPQLLGARSLEGFGDKAPRGMVAHDRIRLIAFPNFFLSPGIDRRRSSLKQLLLQHPAPNALGLKHGSQRL